MPGSGGHRHEGDGPRWVTGRENPGGDPLAVYEHTYAAISGFQLARREARRNGSVARTAGVSAFILAALTLAVLAALAAVRPLQLAWPSARHASPLSLPTPILRPAYAPDVIGTTPARPKAALRVGEARDFAVVAVAGPELHYGWTIDGRPAGTGPRWTYAPPPGEVGRRRVEVVVTGRDGVERRTWNVRVRPARVPRVLQAEPASSTVELVARSPLRLRIDPRSATPVERLTTTWQVDGVPAGAGNTFTLRPERPGVSVVRAVVRSNLGGTASREWRINVAPLSDEPSRQLVRVTPRSEEPARWAVESERERMPARASDAAPALPRYTARGPERRSQEQDVRRWLERYAAAWRAHDVETLRGMGQVTTDDEAAALRRYFESVSELDVKLNVVAMRTDGDRTTVRFTRLDRFRDPAGRLVLKESPLLEKQIVRTPAGLRFARPTG